MPNKENPWLMRLTIQNSRTGQKAFAMYPCEKYAMFESLDWCRLPYGSGDYTHLAVSYNGTRADSLQNTLAGVIENATHPPSIKELNFLGEQIQRMPKQMHSSLEKEIAGNPAATIIEAINATHRLLLEDVVYDGVSMSDRAVLLGSDEPYIRVQLMADGDTLNPDEEDGIWVNCPIQEAELQTVAEALGVSSYRDLAMVSVDGITDKLVVDMLYDKEIAFDEINELARAMKAHDIVRELGKYKAILEFESCFDIEEAAELAGKMDDYEFFQSDTLDQAGSRYRNHNPHDLEYGEMAEDLGFEETNYGVVRKADEMERSHLLPESSQHGRAGEDAALEEKRKISTNKARHAADMPECIRLLSSLEDELQGEKGQVGEWMRISYELNEDFEVAPAEMVQEICDAFRKVNHQYGNHIACALYASQSIVLPSEIVHAADYLSMGGKFKDIRDLAASGVFMSDYDLLGYDLKAEIVALVNSGGSVDELYSLIDSQRRSQTTSPAKADSPTSSIEWTV